MTKLDSIIDEIKIEISNNNQSYEYDKGYEMCKKFINDNSISKKSDIKSIAILACLKCLIYIYSDKRKNLDECEIMAKGFNSIVENDGIKSIVSIINAMITISDEREEIYNEIIEYFEYSFFSGLKSYEIAYHKRKLEDPNFEANNEIYYDFREQIKQIYKLIKKDRTILEIIKYMRKCPESAQKIFDLLLYRKSQIDNNNYQIHDLPFQSIKRILDDIDKFVLEEEANAKELAKENNKRYHMYNRAIALLDEASKKEEITNSSEIINCVQSEEIKRKILLWIDEHNEKYYQSLQNRYNELSSSDTNKCLALLSKYRIPINKQDVSVVLHNSLEDIEEIIKSLPLGELSNEHIISILKTTTKEIALKIKNFIDRGYITPRKVVEHISIYNPKDKKIEMMESSIELLKLLGINPIIFCDQPEYYWVSKELFEKNITLLGRYRLINSIKSETNINFLTEEQLEEKIDMIIELGYYEYLKEDIEILNYNESRIKRLIVLQQANIPVEDLETIEDILESPKFVVEDGEIDEYIMDYASYEKEVEIPKIQNNPINIDNESISVSLEGNIISIPKVRRQLEEGKTIWEAIFYGTKLTEERYNQIMRALKPGNVYIYR